jgi:hypothetical protein
MPSAKFEIVRNVAGFEIGQAVELEIGQDGKPLNSIYNARARRVEVSKPKPKPKTAAKE